MVVLLLLFSHGGGVNCAGWWQQAQKIFNFGSLKRVV